MKNVWIKCLGNSGPYPGICPQWLSHLIKANYMTDQAFIIIIQLPISLPDSDSPETSSFWYLFLIPVQNTVGYILSPFNYAFGCDTRSRWKSMKILSLLLEGGPDLCCLYNEKKRLHWRLGFEYLYIPSI